MREASAASSNLIEFAKAFFAAAWLRHFGTEILAKDVVTVADAPDVDRYGCRSSWRFRLAIRGLGAMLDELVARVSSPGELLELSQTQLDGILLSCVAGRANNADPIASKFVYEDEIVGLYAVGIGATYQQRLAVDHALMESWQRLQSGGLIMQAPGQAPRMMTLSAKGRVAAAGVNFEEIAVRQMLRREMLHPELQGAVYENFASGNYDTAVRDAFVQVEIAVREQAKLAATLVGVKLMREAFNPNTGKLTDTTLPVSERERIADLFAGAIGTFKNPLSHRKGRKYGPGARDRGIVVCEQAVEVRPISRARV